MANGFEWLSAGILQTSIQGIIKCFGANDKPVFFLVALSQQK